MNNGNDGPIENTFNEQLEERFESLDFYVQSVKDGSNFKAIDKAITNANLRHEKKIIQIGRD